MGWGGRGLLWGHAPSHPPSSRRRRVSPARRVFTTFPVRTGALSMGQRHVAKAAASWGLAEDDLPFGRSFGGHVHEIHGPHLETSALAPACEVAESQRLVRVERYLGHGLID